MGNDQSGHEVAQAKADTLDFNAFRRLPRDWEQREQFRVAITYRLDALFREELSAGERAAFDAGNTRDKALDGVLFKFDEFIIRQAVSYGWRLFLSNYVMARIAQWWEVAENGPELLKRLGDQLAQGAKVMRGKDTFPITDPRWYAAKETAKKELRLLLKQYKNTFNQRRRPPNYHEMCDWYREKIIEAANAFPFLRANLEVLLRYFEFVRRDDETRLGRIALGEVGAAELFDSMAACSWNVSEDTARQSISHLGSSKL